jgi:hypothetical protein
MAISLLGETLLSWQGQYRESTQQATTDRPQPKAMHWRKSLIW